MSHDLQDMNLSRDPLNIRLIFDLVFLQNFDSDLLPRQHVSAKPDLAKRPLPKRPTFIQNLINNNNHLPTM